MTHTHRIENGIRVALTPAEIAELDAQTATTDVETDLRSTFKAAHTAPFDVVDKGGTPCKIQCRDQNDLNNIAAVAQASGRKTNGAIIKFRTEDNVNRVFKAKEFADIADAIFDAKQAILEQYWIDRDNI